MRSLHHHSRYAVEWSPSTRMQPWWVSCRKGGSSEMEAWSLTQWKARSRILLSPCTPSTVTYLHDWATCSRSVRPPPAVMQCSHTHCSSHPCKWAHIASSQRSVAKRAGRKNITLATKLCYTIIYQTQMLQMPSSGEPVWTTGHMQGLTGDWSINKSRSVSGLSPQWTASPLFARKLTAAVVKSAAWRFSSLLLRLAPIGSSLKPPLVCWLFSQCASSFL